MIESILYKTAIYCKHLQKIINNKLLSQAKSDEFTFFN